VVSEQDNRIEKEILAQVDQGKTPAQVVADAKADAEINTLENQLKELQAARDADAEAKQEEEVPKAKREEVAAIARELMSKNARMSQCVGTMVAARQLYAVCCNDLDRQITKLPEAQQHELLAECLVQAATHQAAKEFDENDLFMGFQETVWPWMQATIALHNAEEKVERSKELDELESLRRHRKIPLGIKYDPDLGDELRRNDSLVLVGWEPAVRYLIDTIMTNVLTARVPEQLFHIIRLMKAAPTKAEAQRQLTRLGGKDWKNCCKSSTSWPKLFQGRLLDQLSDPLDLLIVDDLAHAYEGLSISGESRNAGEAHKRLRQWSTKMGCGLLGGVPLLSKEIPDLSGAGWHNLRIFSTLRSVWIEEQSDPLYYTLRIGRDAYRENVLKGTLDNYGGSNLILPG